MLPSHHPMPLFMGDQAPSPAPPPRSPLRSQILSAVLTARPTSPAPPHHLTTTSSPHPHHTLTTPLWPPFLRPPFLWQVNSGVFQLPLYAGTPPLALLQQVARR